MADDPFIRAGVLQVIPSFEYAANGLSAETPVVYPTATNLSDELTVIATILLLDVPGMPVGVDHIGDPLEFQGIFIMILKLPLMLYLCP